MAVIANVSSPVESVALSLVIVKFVAFSITPSAAAFVGEIVDAVTLPPYPKMASPYVMQGAFTDEGRYLEPNIGQIWPR